MPQNNKNDDITKLTKKKIDSSLENIKKKKFQKINEILYDLFFLYNFNINFIKK